MAAEESLTWRNHRLPSPTRINLEEPVRVASPTRINLEEQPGLTWRNPSGWPAQPGLTWRNPVRVASPTRIKSFLCPSVSPSVSKG